MKECDMAEQFSRDVDAMLSEPELPACSKPAEYMDSLSLAAELIAADFSDESRIKDVLRERLLVRSDGAGRHSAPTTKEITMRAFIRKKTTIVAATAVVLAVLCVHLGWPGALPAAAQSVGDFINRVVLRHTTVTQVAPISGRVFGEGTLHEVRPEDIKNYATFEEAREAIKFLNIREPHYLPEGYSVAGITVIEDTVSIDLVGKSKPINLVEYPAGTHRREMTTDRSTKQVDINGEAGCWIDNNWLKWEDDEISCNLWGDSLTEDEAVKIAESMTE